MSLILKQEPANTIATPPAGKSTLFVNDNSVMSVKSPDGNVTQFPTVQGSNTQVFFNDNGAINGNANLTFDKTTSTMSVVNLSVTGNLNAGDISVSSIANGTSNVDIIGVGGNVTTSVNGTANVLVVTATGANVTGTFSVSGNANIGNIGTAGLITATGNIGGGNINTGGVVSAAGNITASYFIGNGSQLTGIDATTIQNGTANVRTFLNGNVTVSSSGNANIIVVTGTGANVDGTLSVSGNIAAGNVSATTFTGALSGAATSATTAGTVTTAAQPNITSVGTLTSLSSSGNITGGNLNTLGNVNASIIVDGGTGMYLSAGPSGYINFFTTGGDKASISDTGNITASNVIANSTVFATTANISGNVNAGNITTGGQLSVTGNATVGNLVTGAGSGGNISGANNISANTFTGTLTTAAQPNITSVGTLTSLGVSGNASANNLSTTNKITAGVGLQVTTGALSVLAGNLDVTGNLNVSGNVNYSNVTDLVVGDPLIYIGANNTGDTYDLGIVASYNDGVYEHTGLARNASNDIWTFFDGVVAEPTTTIDWANATYPTVKLGNLQATGTLSAVGNANVGNIGATGGVFTTVAGALTTASQPNVTSLGTLTSLSISGNANIGNIGTAGTLTVTGNATVGNLIAGSGSGGNISGANLVSANYFTGTLTTAAQPNVTSVGTLTSLSVNGTVTAVAVTANTGIFTGNGSGLTSLTGGNVTGQVANALVAGTVYTAAQPNITSLGTLSSLSVSGNANVGNIGATNLVGTLTTASQTNITAVGTLASLSVTANANIGNIGTAGLITATGNIGGGNLNTSGLVSAVGNVIAGNVYANSGIGGFTTLSASGNVTGANVNATTYNITGVTTGISAAGSTQGTATALTKSFNVVSTVSAGQGVVLPTAVAGMRITVVNTSGATLLVYPASGGAINALATNAGYSLPTLGRLDYVAVSSSQWYAMGAIYA